MSKPQKLCLRAVEFSSSGQGDDGRTLEGYAAVFDSPTRIDSWEGSFDETIARGAFAKTLSERKPVLQFDHGKDVRTGSVPIGSIQEIREDSRGLYVKARLFDNHAVEPIRQAIEGGAIDGMSFRFRVNNDEWRDRDGGLVRESELKDLLSYPDERGPLKRTIREVELYEAGPVVFPAYEATSVGVRSLLGFLDEEDRASLLEELLERASSKSRPKRKPMDDEDEDAPKKGSKPATGDEEDDGEDDEDAPKKGSKKPPAKKKSTSTYDSGLSFDERSALLRGLDL